MERIKQAMERAHVERQHLTAATAAPRRQPEGTTTPRAIEYTVTRVQPLDPRHAARNRLLLDGASGPAVVAFDLLRTRVLQEMRRNAWRTLAVTSPRGGEGKTVVGINLALAIARDVNHTVLLVDLDLRHPSVHRYLGLDVSHGLVDHLLGTATLPQVMVNPGVERLVVIPGREPVAHSSELLASPDMAALVEELKGRYPSRLLVFDLPPLLSADDALAFAPYTDAALLVAREGTTARDELLQARDFLGPTPILGTVLNRAAEPQASPY